MRLYIVGLLLSLLSFDCYARAAPPQSAPGVKQPTYSDFFGPSHSTLSPERPQGTAKIPVQIGKYDYAIPANYLDMTPNPNCSTSGVLMFALLPDFEPKTPENDKYFHMFDDERPWGTVHIDKPAHITGSINQFFETGFKIAKEIDPHVSNEGAYGLEVWKASNQARSISKDVFASKDHGELKSFISCSLPGPGLWPVCTDTFISNNAQVDFLFPRAWLPKWAKLEADARKFVSGLTVGLSPNPKPVCEKN